MKKSVFNSAISGFEKYMHQGLLMAVGADPIARGAGGGVSRWRFFGKEFSTPGEGWDIKDATDLTGSARRWSIGQGVFGAVASTAALAEGYSSGGLKGAATALSYDVSINAAIARHAPITSDGMGMAGYAGRYLGGMVGAQATSAILPGFLGTAAGIGGGYLGVRAAGAIGGLARSIKNRPFTALGLGGAALVASAPAMATAASAGAIGVTMKAGYNHAQMQKQIHTSGSLAAFHTQGAHTMRARAVQAIHKSHLNSRSALGMEANFMHYPSKNYHSRYRVF